ncbi:MAG: ABC transporter permease subunit [Actinomycetota bacterium]
MATATVLSHERGLGAVWSKTLRDQRRTLLWWGAGILLVVLMYAAFYPSVKANADQFTSYMKNLPKAVKDMVGGTNIASPAGYLNSEIFSFMGPILLLVYAIGAGARAIAGEEESGTLDLLLSTPVRRRTVVLDKFVAMLVGTSALGAVAWLGTVAVAPAFGLHVAIANLTAAFLNLFLLGLAFGAVALAVGAATGSKSLAIGVAAGAAVLTFLLKTFAAAVSWLEPYRVLSPFYYYTGHDPLRNGFRPLDPIVLAGIAAVAIVIGLVTFEDRDLAT